MKRLNLLWASVLVASALLLSAASGAHGLKPVPREMAECPANQRIQGQRASHANEQVADNTVAPISGVHSEDNRNEESNPASKQEKPDWMVRLTVILCVITGIQALIFLNQYRAMVFSERAQIIIVPTPSINATQQQRVVFQITTTPQAANPPNAPNQPSPQQLQLPAVPAVPQIPDGLILFGPNQHSAFKATIK